MMMPKRTKYRKQQKGRLRGKASRGVNMSFGDFALQVMETGFITARQIEAARIAMTRFIKRGGRVWIRIFPDKPMTSKPAETRMGSGKGSPEYWVAPVQAGRIIYEMEGVTPEIAIKAFTLAKHKLPLKTKILTRENYREV
jgi:large subunit ribosomal protein L16